MDTPRDPAGKLTPDEREAMRKLIGDLQELERRAIPAPWRANGAGDIEHHYRDEEYGDAIDSVATQVYSDSDEFIVEVRNNFPAIVQYLEARDRECDRLKEELGQKGIELNVCKASAAFKAHCSLREENDRLKEELRVAREALRKIQTTDFMDADGWRKPTNEARVARDALSQLRHE